MLNFLFSGLVALIEEALSAAVDLFLLAFDMSRESFDQVFPFAAASFHLFQNIGLAIVLFIGVCQIINIVRSGDRIRETPINIVFNSILAVVGIYMGNYLLEGIISLVTSNYNAISNAEISIGMPEVGFMDSVISVLSSAFYSVSIVLYLILLFMIGIQFVMVLLEAVERYVVLFVLLYLSPLFFSTLASKPTSAIFKKFFSMFVSQCLLMVLNIWSVKMALSVFASIGTIGHTETIVVPLIMAFAFLRVAQRLDTYLNQCGLNAAVTGAGLGADLFSSFASIGKMAGGAFGSIVPGGGPKTGGGGSGSAGAGGVIGTAQRVAQTYGKYSPVAGAADGIRNHVKAEGSTILGAVGHGVESVRSGGTFAGAAKDFYDGNIEKAHVMAESKTQADNILVDMAAAPEGYATQTDAMAATMMDSDAAFTNEMAEVIRERDGVATAVLNKMATTKTKTQIRDNARNVAMLASMKIAGTEGFVQAGSSSASGLASVTGKDGMIFSYKDANKGGKFQTLQVKNHAQYSALSANDKLAYQEVVTPDGSKKYVRFDTQEQQPEVFNNESAPNGSPDFGGPGRISSRIPDTSSTKTGSGFVDTGEPELPEYRQGNYTDEEIYRARYQAYQFHSGGELAQDLTPVVAGEVMDGYANNGVMPFGSAYKMGGTMEAPQQTNTNRTSTRSQSSTPSRMDDYDVERIYRVAKATGSKNIPRRDAVVRAHQDHTGIRMSTENGTWEMRTQKYVDSLPEVERAKYNADFRSPRGNQYYSRFQKRPSREQVVDKRKNESQK